MDTDYSLVLGLLFGAFAIPSLLNAAVEGRAPRLAMIMVLISGALLAHAITNRPGGVSFNDIPEAFTRVINEVARQAPT